MLNSLSKTFVVATLVTLSSVAVAGDQGPTQKMQAPTQRKMLTGGYFSQTLRCQFTVRTVQFNGYTVRAARLVSNPEWGSPLRKLGLRQGDVIFRLDGVPVANNYELDNHYSWTTVRYSRQGVSQIENGKIYIDNQQLADNSDDFLGQP